MLRFVWPLPFTLLAGVVVCLFMPLGVTLTVRDRSIQASGPGCAMLLKVLVPWMNVSGLTIGHVVIYRTRDDAAVLHAHEIVHVRQWERWGIIFPWAYATASLVATLQGGHYYRDNAFEVAARREAGY